MTGYATGLIFRTWKVLQSGELKDISPQLTTKAIRPLKDFVSELIASPAIHEINAAGVAIADNEFLIYISSEEGGPLDCIVTNRKLIFLNTGPTRTCLFSSVTGIETMLSRSGNPGRIRMERKRGHPLDMQFAAEASTAAIKFAADKYDEQWNPLEGITEDELQELDPMLKQPEFAAQANTAFEGPAQDKSAAKQAASERGHSSSPRKSEKETWGSIFAEMIPMYVGFVVFAMVLLIAGAPIFQGGREVIWWLSNDNMGHFYGAAIAGILAAIFWPRKN